MSLLQDALRQPVVIRLGWTLVHFLWQGAVVALAVALVLWFMRRRSAEARYAIACGALALVAACPVVTFSVLPEQASVAGIRADSSPLGGMSTSRAPGLADFGERSRAANRNVYPTPDTAAPLATENVGRPTGLRLALLHRVADRLLPWLVALWGVGVLVLSVRLVGGYVGVQWARRDATEASHPAMQRRLAALAYRMGVMRPVRLMQSARVAGPAVVGILKPVILFPASALTGLWPIQIEAILAHELAHIQRHDYLVNLLQSLVETLLFYHPAVWWLSNRIRQEREHCCDDIAADVCGDRVFYAASLAELDELRGARLALAMGAHGMGLMPRVRRLLRLPSGQDVFDAWSSGSLVGTLALAVAIVFLARSTALKAEKQSIAAAPRVPTTLVARVGKAAPVIAAPVKTSAIINDAAPARSAIASLRRSRTDDFVSDFGPMNATANGRDFGPSNERTAAGTGSGDFINGPDRDAAAANDAVPAAPQRPAARPAANQGNGPAGPAGPMVGGPGNARPTGITDGDGRSFGRWGPYDFGFYPWYGTPSAQPGPTTKPSRPSHSAPEPPSSTAPGHGSGAAPPPRHRAPPPVERPLPVHPDGNGGLGRSHEMQLPATGAEEAAPPDFPGPTLQPHTISPASGVIVQPSPTDEVGGRPVRIVIREQAPISEEAAATSRAASARQTALPAAPRAADPPRGRTQR